MRLLKKLFTHSGQAVQPVSRDIPEEVRLWVKAWDYAALQSWLQREFGRTNDIDSLEAIISAMQEAGWPEVDRDRFEVYGLYIAGRHLEAYERSRPYIKPGAPYDADFIILAAWSLYLANTYDAAWQVIEQWIDHWSDLETRIDFLAVAMMVSHAAGKQELALSFLDKGRRLAPDNPILALNGYGIYFELGATHAFEAVQAEIDAGKYDLIEAAVAISRVVLAQDHYAAGFRILEGRYAMSEASRYINPSLLDFPRWQGDPLAGRTLLVTCEQGLGDTVMMARYFPRLAEAGAGEVIVETPLPALSLLHSNFPQYTFVELRMGHVPERKFDLWVGSMSLPHQCGATAENIPSKSGYLRPPPENAAYWVSRLAELADGHRPRIGVAWSGSRTHRDDRRRSIPAETFFTAIRGVDADFFSLQKEIPADRPANLFDLSEELITLADTAALIEALDLVITVDSSPIHLAGALGKEAWLMLPYRYEWRWGMEGESNRWYDSVRVIRQRSHGDWAGVLDEVFDRRLPAWRAERGQL